MKATYVLFPLAISLLISGCNALNPPPPPREGALCNDGMKTYGPRYIPGKLTELEKSPPPAGQVALAYFGAQNDQLWISPRATWPSPDGSTAIVAGVFIFWDRMANPSTDPVSVLFRDEALYEGETVLDGEERRVYQGLFVGRFPTDFPHRTRVLPMDFTVLGAKGYENLRWMVVKDGLIYLVGESQRSDWGGVYDPIPYDTPFVAALDERTLELRWVRKAKAHFGQNFPDPTSSLLHATAAAPYLEGPGILFATVGDPSTELWRAYPDGRVENVTPASAPTMHAAQILPTGDGAYWVASGPVYYEGPQNQVVWDRHPGVRAFLTDGQGNLLARFEAFADYKELVEQEGGYFGEAAYAVVPDTKELLFRIPIYAREAPDGQRLIGYDGFGGGTILGRVDRRGEMRFTVYRPIPLTGTPTPQDHWPVNAVGFFPLRWPYGLFKVAGPTCLEDWYLDAEGVPSALGYLVYAGLARMEGDQLVVYKETLSPDLDLGQIFGPGWGGAVSTDSLMHALPDGSLFTAVIVRSAELFDYHYVHRNYLWSPAYPQASGPHSVAILGRFRPNWSW